ncbi:hypothetical protein NSPZN2_50294 [Nitrospira defluvii]|uniref:Transposase n=1 Tax=Nitrospira defluvii TaxID=330214 RepID=A0ABN7M7L1_9BACT|nr:hypothetical protein NSPZN2_50294 [Nitrospira defluvii]
MLNRVASEMNPIVHPCGLFLDGSPIVPRGYLRMDLTGCGVPAVRVADSSGHFFLALGCAEG